MKVKKYNPKEWVEVVDNRTEYTSAFGKVWSETDHGKISWYVLTPFSKRSIGAFKTAKIAQDFLVKINKDELKLIKYIEKLNRMSNEYSTDYFYCGVCN